jgi:protease-4
MFGLLASGCMPGSFLVTPVTADRELQEQVLSRDSVFSGDKIAVVDVDGIIVNADKPGLLRTGDNPVAYLLEQLDAARHDPAVKAVILRINSPGGGVTASELMHNELQRFRADGKPVVTMMLDVAASGGYYIACASDEIIASRSTVTGSIGVIMQTFDLTGTLGKIGARAEAIKSGPQKGGGSPFESMTPEQRAVFQKMIEQMYQQFVDVVVAGRPNLTRERVLQLADGRVYLGTQALEVGLVDKLGTMQDAIEAAKARAKVESIQLVTYRRAWGYAGNYYAAAQANAAALQVNMVNFDLQNVGRQLGPPFMYLWTGP